METRIKPDGIYLRVEDGTLWFTTDVKGSQLRRLVTPAAFHTVAILFDSEILPPGWREIDIQGLQSLVAKVDEIGEETEPDLTYLFTDSEQGIAKRNRRIRSTTGDDGYTALAKEIAALGESAETGD